MGVQAAQIARPVFDSSRRFKIEAPASARPLATTPVPAFVFNDAIRKCNVNPSQLAGYLENALHPSRSTIWETLQALLPSFAVQSLKGLQILFDSFDGLTQEFRSFYLPHQAQIQPTLVIDCSSATIHNAAGFLGHEFVHHFNAKRNLAPWIDEMIAQLAEIRIHQSYPEHRYFLLSQQATTPSFFAREKTFQSSEQYAVNSLFGFYIASNYGGANMIAAIPSGSRTLTDFTDALLTYRLKHPELKFVTQNLRPRDLIRQFALAMNINQETRESETLYKVPGWKGFPLETIAIEGGLHVIEPGGFLRVHKKWADRLSQLPDSLLEIYHIRKSFQGFEVTKLGDASPKIWEEDYLLLINTSSRFDAKIRLQ